MNLMQTHRQPLIGALIACASVAASAQVPPAARNAAPGAAQVAIRAPSSAEAAESALKARYLVTEAVQVIGRLKQEARTAELLQQAKGIFIVPGYGRVSIVSQGGPGVLTTRADGGAWSNPVFYTLAGVSVSSKTGRADEQVVWFLMTQNAVDAFRTNSDFSLDREAGLTVANIARRASMGDKSVRDVITWSGAEGAFAGASAGVTDVKLDRAATNAYYGLTAVTPAQVLDGAVVSPYSNVLGTVLSR